MSSVVEFFFYSVIFSMFRVIWYEFQQEAFVRNSTLNTFRQFHSNVGFNLKDNPHFLWRGGGGAESIPSAEERMKNWKTNVYPNIQISQLFIRNVNCWHSTAFDNRNWFIYHFSSSLPTLTYFTFDYIRIEAK